MNNHNDKYVTVDTVASRWNVSAKTIQRLIHAGSLRAAKFGTKNFRVLFEDVIAYEKIAESRVS